MKPKYNTNFIIKILHFYVFRWKDCLVSVTNDLGFAVGYAYIKQHFNDEAMIMVRTQSSFYLKFLMLSREK